MPNLLSPGSFDMMPIFQHGQTGARDPVVGAASGGASGSALLAGLFGEYDINKKSVPDLLRAAIGEAAATHEDMLGAVEGYGEGARAALEQDFTTQFNNIAGLLESRGLGASSGYGGAAAAFQRERQLGLGQLNDMILGRRLEVLGSNPLPGLLAGLGEMEFNADLQRDLLRAQQQQPLSLGNVRESATLSGNAAINSQRMRQL